MQRFANRLFINVLATDVAKTAEQTNEILQSIGTLDEMLERFAGVLSEAVGTDRVAILLLEKGRYEQAFPPPGGGEDDSETEPALTLPADGPIARGISTLAEPLVADIIHRRRDSEDRLAAARRLHEMKYTAAVGIRGKGVLEGMMLLGPRLSGRVYGAREQQALQVAADQLALGLDNARLYTEIQDAKMYNDVLVDNLLSGVIAADAQRVVTVFNREAQRITGLAPSAVLGHPVDALPYPLREYLVEAFVTGEGVPNHEILFGEGKPDPVHLQLGSSVFRGVEKNVLGVLVLFSDLSVTKELEAQVRRSSHLASLGTLSAGMAHEIKNPLVALQTFCQLLPERYDDPVFRERFSELAGREVGRIDSIVRQLLAFSRPSKPELAPVSVREILDRSLDLIRVPLHRKGIVLVTEWGAEVDVIEGDARLLEQAFVNFFLNAVEVMQDGGRLTIQTELAAGVNAERHSWQRALKGDHLHVMVQDTGPGMSPEILSRVFDPFFTTKSVGTGLGLSVAHGIITDHKGMIDVESEVGEGTTFHVLLPLSGNGTKAPNRVAEAVSRAETIRG
jgi:signal transduction histidine kinase